MSAMVRGHEVRRGKDWTEGPDRPLRVYIAGPLFSHAERRFNIELNNMIRSLGYETYFPQEDAGLISEMVERGLEVHQARDAIFERNRLAVMESDIVLFILDGRAPDEGACIEAGIGYALGKFCIGLKTDFRTCEPGGNNLMIDGVVQYRIAADLQQLVQRLQEAEQELRLTQPPPLAVTESGRARPYIAVVGSIGTGKSTLVRILSERAGWTRIDEPVEENPYLNGVYQNLEGLALRVQAFYLGGRTRQHMRALEIDGPAAQDRCLYEDTEVFAATYHELGAFDSIDLTTLQTLYRALAELLPRPDLLLYVHAPLQVQQERIRQRGRDFEQAIDSTFLEALNRNYAAWIDRQGWAPVLKVDSGAENFADDVRARQRLFRRVDRAIEEAARFTPERVFARLPADVG
jgi:deoxyadenosine/deoxycytidine kinase/nucleoside 2-deoxyribosyltransferase